MPESRALQDGKRVGTVLAVILFPLIFVIAFIPLLSRLPDDSF